MAIPKNITEEHLLKAISKIDNDGIPRDGDSQYYDVVYNGRRYPPKLIVSYANIFANGKELDRNKFEGGLDTECFKLLEDNGFQIINKANRIVEKIKRFAKIYKSEVNLKHSSDLKSFELLVNESPRDVMSEISRFSIHIRSEGSIGRGVNTNYPWLGIFDNRVSTGATNGFYVVFLFSDDFEDIYLTLNQGSTIQTKEQIEAYRNFVFSLYPSVEGFEKGRIPKGGLVKTKSGSAAKKYEETNIFYRKYAVASLKEEDFNSHLIRIVKVYVDCAEKYSRNEPTKSNDMGLDYKKFHADLNQAGVFISSSYSLRFISSLLTKPFVILTGLSGSGKTKLATSFAKWICEDKKQHCIVPVGADWTNREPLLGFPNAIDKNTYVKPDNGVLDLIIEASKPENTSKPFLIILDEMNLSHVERYFADFLSVMESKDDKGFLLHSDKIRTDTANNLIPNTIQLPKNLFIIGTVNIDETTYMFSPKVLDRASVIEFRVTKDEMRTYLKNKLILNLNELNGSGKEMAASFTAIAEDGKLELEDSGEINDILLEFFSELKKVGAEFGYRSASEILRFASIINYLEPEWKTSDILDAAIMQKLLPKVHGSRKRLAPVLETLGNLCMTEKPNEGEKMEHFLNPQEEKDFSSRIKYPMSFEKNRKNVQGPPSQWVHKLRRSLTLND